MAWSFWFLAIRLVVGADALAPETYQSAVEAYQKKQYKKSTRLFQLILSSLKSEEAKVPKDSKSHTMLVLGQCDLYFYLGQIARHQGDSRRACLHLQQVATRLARVPKAWKTWAVQPHLLTHMQSAEKLFSSLCPKVPSLVHVATEPKDARVSYRMALPDNWKPAKGHVLRLLQAGKVFVRAEKPGYKTTSSQVQVPRWGQTKLRLILPVLPPVLRRIGLRRQPPKRLPPKRLSPVALSTPFYQTWWFWTVTGVAVAGVGTGVALYFALPRPLAIGANSTIW